ncbi:MAG: SUMF1/EgtB/PvdO family nonheme iron enzyme [Myxococcales bacterium]|nr:SUMF1/EgtB/PvdO family nonheme iron enzyme [Myxococcales bacterium]
MQLGRPPVSDAYGWGNEYGTLEVNVPPFLATTTLVSNADYARFVADGGYRRPELWTKAGWASLGGATHPRFWVPEAGGGFSYRAQFDVRPLPRAWPAEVNGHEAAAYARWAGARLPTEQEWAALAADAPTHDADVIGVAGYNLNLRHGSSVPVDHGVATPLGFHDVHGNVWQWLADDFAPLPGFRAHPLYPDFSLPYFDDQHATLRGGSWATTGTGASRYYRLWFRRHFAQHAGFRLAREA